MKAIIPDVVGRTDIMTYPLTATVQEASEGMAAKRIGAIIVGTTKEMVGIFTERDLLTRVIAKELDPKTTLLSAVMTPNPDTLPPDANPVEALKTMQSRNFRHLPIVENGILVSMISIRDLYAAIIVMLESDLQSRDALLFGEYAVG